ncbi:MAG: hypothetical protein JO051_05290, partial [Acidobacteriaceae bacterium]|nr:hypothetical protein [Acidobacteriaceae bacterium]
VVASGGALLHSKAWLQMMTDSLGHRVLQCMEAEASSRGAAMIAAEQMGALSSLDDVPVKIGARLEPQPERTRTFERLLARDTWLFNTLYGTAPTPAAHLGMFETQPPLG